MTHPLAKPPESLGAATLKLPPIETNLQRYRPKKETILSHGHIVDFDSSYSRDYSEKPLLTRITKPSSPARRHNPQPSQVYHVRRLCNEPICHVKTLFNRENMNAMNTNEPFMTSTAQHFPQRELPSHRNTRFGCNINKHLFAMGIVPSDSETIDMESEDSITARERMLPACSRTTIMTTVKPYVPRRKRLEPASLSEGWKMSEPLSFLVKDDVGRSTGIRRAMRKRIIPGSRVTSLQVPGFDGGLPKNSEQSITGRKLSKRPQEFYDYYIKVAAATKAQKEKMKTKPWMKPF
ncbi:uncharacterized protein LOC100374302 [Saccoglossus kowalevskii]|uniref:Uncharacterized protein LOC100374302 isoform X1 n=1 Tax=Saccoglossus kowalevskii TaxID=10224 RepID=A0ABM0GJT5_SACKO|nr:PREDICTED: uncharacterized protein LOC100374302 isoform X1 [Saccoglossus kowalevskii]